MTHEQDIAKKIASMLDQATDDLDRTTLSRLADARRQAVELAAHSQHSSLLATVTGGLGEFLGQWYMQHRLAALVVLVALLLAAILLHQGLHQPMEADALLLASELPPEAYLDKGFDAWLEQSSLP